MDLLSPSGWCNKWNVQFDMLEGVCRSVRKNRQRRLSIRERLVLVAALPGWLSLLRASEATGAAHRASPYRALWKQEQHRCRRRQSGNRWPPRRCRGLALVGTNSREPRSVREDCEGCDATSALRRCAGASSMGSVRWALLRLGRRQRDILSSPGPHSRRRHQCAGVQRQSGGCAREILPAHLQQRCRIVKAGQAGPVTKFR
uniref:Transposase n=1 Tax=Macrostomum lignano TaxID=282301 RepID=A0A1I8IT10_9PLAT